MYVMIEAVLAPDASGEGVLTQETIDDTKAEVLTVDQATARSLPVTADAPAGVERLIVVVPKIDERRIMNALEASEQVAQFRVEFVDL